MVENQERTDLDVVITISAGLGMLVNLIVMTKAFYEIGQEVAPIIQEYVGSIGSGIVEYGLPGLVGLAMAHVSVIATKATDQYLLNRRYNPEGL